VTVDHVMCCNVPTVVCINEILNFDKRMKKKKTDEESERPVACERAVKTPIKL